MVKYENILITILGVVTVLLFLLLLFSGGLFESIDDLLFKEVSFIISPYSPFKYITIPIYQLYNLSLLLFSTVLILRLRNKYARTGGIYLLLSSIIAILLIYFPMDQRGISQSTEGAIHIVAVLIIALYIVIALMLFAFAFKNSHNLSWLSRYTFVISLILLITGSFTGLFAILSMPEFVGLIERVPMLSFLIWILITSIGMLKSDKRIKYHLLFSDD